MRGVCIPKKIAVIGTGGTISSELVNNLRVPTYGIDTLISDVDTGEPYTIKPRHLSMIDSSDMRPSNWQTIAMEIDKAKKEGADAFVVPHGTNTLHFTAAALSYFLWNYGPVVITGSKFGPTVRNSDAQKNFLDSLKVAYQMAMDEIDGVYTVFCERVIVGTHVFEAYPGNRDAFRSIYHKQAGWVRDGRLVPRIEFPKIAYNIDPRWSEVGKVPYAPYALHTDLDERIYATKMHPSLDPRTLKKIMDDDYHGLVIEGYPGGGIRVQPRDLLQTLIKIKDEGKSVVVTQNETTGGSMEDQYPVVRDYIDAGIMPGWNMTYTSALIKLMLAHGYTHDPKAVRTIFYTPVADDIEPHPELIEHENGWPDGYSNGNKNVRNYGNDRTDDTGLIYPEYKGPASGSPIEALRR